MRKPTDTRTAAGQPEERVAIAHTACCHIDALIHMLRREQKVDCSSFPDVLASTLRRIEVLNSVVLSVLGEDDLEPLEAMQRAVHG